MHRLFHPENPVMRFIGKIGYSIYLNLLWAICSLPVITAGAATTALFTVMQKIVVDEEGEITLSFFRAFRSNFRQSTLTWLILLVVGIFLGTDGYILYHIHSESFFWTILTAIFFPVLAVYAIILMYIFPLMAHFNNTIPAMFKNSLMIGMRFLLCTFLMALVYFGVWYIAVNLYTPVIFLGEGFCAFLCSWLLKNILIQCEEKQ